jgi:hypothetical protein
MATSPTLATIVRSQFAAVVSAYPELAHAGVGYYRSGGSLYKTMDVLLRPLPLSQANGVNLLPGDEIATCVPSAPDAMWTDWQPVNTDYLDLGTGLAKYDVKYGVLDAAKVTWTFYVRRRIA